MPPTSRRYSTADIVLYLTLVGVGVATLALLAAAIWQIIIP